VFTGPPRDIGFQENLGSAAPVQLLLGALSSWTRDHWFRVASITLTASAIVFV
jgi:hypothetical protein